MGLESLPRVRLANLPTPMVEMKNLSKALGGPRIFIKRDDMTGLGFGGNKTRKLEYIMADALRRKADTIITGAGFHSNWCTQTACAAKKLGMRIVLIKQGPVKGYDPDEYDGNHLLHFILGSEIRVASSMTEADELAEELAGELELMGRRPYIIFSAGSNPVGVTGYVNAMLEILTQSVEMSVGIDFLVHATGSGGTQAGLILGSKAFNTGTKVLGISVSRSKDRIEKILRLAADSARLLGYDLSLEKDDVEVVDRYVGGGYGVINREVVEAIKLVAEAEGIFLDPVYTGKAMAGLIDLIQRNYFDKGDNVLFLHTGGTAALFPYRGPLKAFIKGAEPPWARPPWSAG